MLIKSTKWEQLQKSSFQKRHIPFQKAISDGSEKGYDFDGFSQDLFSALYQIAPEFPETSTTGKAIYRKALEELKNLPEYKQIREAGTKCDSFQSGLGATVLTKHFVKAFPQAPKEKNPDDIEKEIKNLEEFLKDLPSNHEKFNKFNDQLSTAKNALEPAESAWKDANDALDPSSIRQVLRRALVDAQDQIDREEAQANAFGFGTEPGTDGYNGNTQLKLAMAQKIRHNLKLQKIADLAGRFRREARKQQANKKQPGPDEITDIEVGNDLGRLIPAELVLLNDPLTELDFQRKYLERSLIQYKLEETPKETKGPIIVCIDTSGSMAGERDVWAKSIFCALAQIAADTKRSIAVILFDADIQLFTVFENGKITPEDMIDICNSFSGGGTNFAKPLKNAFDTIKSTSKKDLKKADIIMITDGCAPIDASDKKAFIENKKDTGASIYSIIIGASAPDLESVSDKVFLLSEVLDDDEEAKETIFSI